MPFEIYGVYISCHRVTFFSLEHVPATSMYTFRVSRYILEIMISTCNFWQAAWDCEQAVKRFPNYLISERGWYGWKPSSSSNVSIWVVRACPLIETRQAAPCRAIRGSNISVNSTLCSSYACQQTFIYIYIYIERERDNLLWHRIHL